MDKMSLKKDALLKLAEYLTERLQLGPISFGFLNDEIRSILNLEELGNHDRLELTYRIDSICHNIVDGKILFEQLTDQFAAIYGDYAGRRAEKYMIDEFHKKQAAKLKVNEEEE